MRSELFIVLAAFAVAIPAQEYLCDQHLDKGHACKNKKPEVKVYFDKETRQCLRFLYLGCGGTDNRFDDERNCSGQCFLEDGSPCSGKAGPDCTQVVLEFSYPTKQPTRRDATPIEPKCPDGFSCRNGFTISTCCNDKVEEEYANAYKPKCTNGKKPTPRSKSDDSPIFGKSCKDELCPDGSTCHDANVWAFCCPK